MRKIKLISVDGEANRWAELVVVENSHMALKARVDSLQGDPESPISIEYRIAKAHALLDPIVGGQDAAVLIEHWMEAPKTSSLWPRLSLSQKD